MKLQSKKIAALVLSASMLAALSACGVSAKQTTDSATETETILETLAYEPAESTDAQTEESDSALFTERDLNQTPDLSDAEEITLTDGQTCTITEAGTYLLTGTAENAQVVVEAAEDAKVQLVLDALTVTNDAQPVIYIKSADKVFVTTTDSENTLSVTGAFTADGETNTDAVIFSKEDLVLNGTGTLTISSTDNGISCKDDLKITGGTYVISCASDALEANDSISIADGDFTITAGKDGLHCENDEDLSLGSICILGGSFQIEAGSDGIQGTTLTEIDGGDFEISAAEGIESTYIQINGGNLSIYATDDGINASQKSSACNVCIEITGGSLSVTMAQGDTDAIDSNGSILVSGGTIDISAQFAFDFVTTASHTGGTITVNGETVEEITESMMMGGFGGMGGQGQPGPMGGGRGF